MRALLLGLALPAVLAVAAPAAGEPTWWLAVGGQVGVETGRLRKVVNRENSGVLAAGWYLFQLGPVFVGPETEGSGGRLGADLGTRDDDVTVLRGRLGVRVLWWGDEDDEPWLVAYLRAGVAYRQDDGRFVDDDGVGWYGGLGLDVRLSENWSLGPFVTYERVSLSIETETVLVGLALTFSY